MPLTRLIEGLLRDEELLERVLQQLPSGVAVYDNGGRLSLHNQRAEALLGVRPEAVSSYKLFALTGEEVPPDRSPLCRALGGESVEPTDYAVRQPDNTVRRLRISAVPIRAGAEISGVVVLIVDVTELGAGEAIQRDVLGIVGHDLRNPLSAIRMTAQMLARPTPMPDERRRELAERILSSSKRMDNIVSALLDYARAKVGAVIQLRREPVSLEAVCRRVVAEQEAAAPNRPFEIRVAGGALEGSWDEARLEQVVSNLVSNAVAHGDLGTPVTVTLDGASPTTVLIQVHNQGPPIPPELQAQLFMPFKTGTSTTRRGMGLGLFIVKHMVEAHGGSVSLRSVEGEGTTFSVVLPRSFVG